MPTAAANTVVKEAVTPSPAPRSFSFRRLSQASRLSKSAGSSPPASFSAAVTATSSPNSTAAQLTLGSPPQLSLGLTSASHLGNSHPGLGDDFFSEPLKTGNFTITSIIRDSNVSTSDVPEPPKPSLAPSALFEYDTSAENPHIKTQPQITISTFLKPSDPMDDTSYQRPSSVGNSPNFLDLKSRPVSESFTNSSRHSWTSPSVSRSPSPSSRDERSSRDENDSRSTSSVSSSASPTKSGAEDFVESKSEFLLARPGVTRSSSILGKARRPLSFLRSSGSEPTVPLALPPKEPRRESNSSSSNDRPSQKKVKDELWEGFKLLENDFQRFQSKSTLQKANIIRQALVPFLRKFDGRSSTNITPDELDRRVRVLHRWWTGLLAQLRIRNTQAIAGTDRPIYLEGISGLMSRPEWRSAPSTFAPLSQRMTTTPKSQSSSSLASTSSAYSVQKSVQHNIKVLFTRTLYDTLGFTVEKMGLRTSPPSMVAFGGKVLAYAFYFCPGVAQMLISLWELQPATVRRVLPEFGVGRGTDLREVSEAIVSDFPEVIQSLGFTTLGALLREMKKPRKPPVGIQIEWYGQWTSRWCGRDSDLSFIFLKYYHILLCDYLPADASPLARLTAPGYVMVHAHLLSMIDNTIHRQSTALGIESLASTTFEEMLANATAALPMAPRNPARTMADNKMVVLLRDIIADRVHCSEQCREMYIRSFMAMTKAAVTRTRLFDADACFTVCELMEELLPIFSQAEKQCKTTFIDWPFWMDVVRQMLQSENNMTELRLISFVYTAWDVVVEDEERKRSICLGWLLSEAVWDKFFCHWCPMVRAYFMRLVCWRIGRYNGSRSALDLNILEALLVRLRTADAHYLRLKDKAEVTNSPPPSTAPCLPQPCRRLVILRSDVLTTPQGVFLDGLMPPASLMASSNSLPQGQLSAPLTATTATSLGDLHSVMSGDSTDTKQSGSSEASGSTLGKRWSAFRNVISFRAPVNDASSPSPDSRPSRLRKKPASASSKGSPKREPSPPTQQSTRKKTTFKFSLEWVERPPFGIRDRKLGPGKIPREGQKYVDEELAVPLSVDLSGYTCYASHWTYVGRALAEWAVVVMEYENFFDRRKLEGRESDNDVETPSLVVDPARKF